MLRDAAVEIIKRGVGFRRGTALDATIIAALKQAQAEFEGAHSLPWFLRQENQTQALTSGTASYALPTGFVDIDNTFNPTYIVDSASEEAMVTPIAYDEGKALFISSASGVPIHYSIRTSTIVFFPTPDDSYTFYWSYYKTADTLDTNIENLWLLHAPYVLIANAGLKVATDIRDLEATAIYKAEVQKWNDWFTRRMTEKLEQNTRYAVGRYA